MKNLCKEKKNIFGVLDSVVLDQHSRNAFLRSQPLLSPPPPNLGSLSVSRKGFEYIYRLDIIQFWTHLVVAQHQLTIKVLELQRDTWWGLKDRWNHVRFWKIWCMIGLSHFSGVTIDSEHCQKSCLRCLDLRWPQIAVQRVQSKTNFGLDWSLKLI